MLVMLIGYRGSGKTTVGRRLASDLWYGFCDTDSLIAQRQGKTIAELFRESGEQAFRDIESEVVRECCTLKDHVVALGGGAVIRELNRRLLRQSGAKVFYLRCDPAELIRRIQADPASAANRPPLTPLGDSVEEVHRVLSEREAQYREVAGGELDVTRLTVEEAARYLARML